MKHLYERLVSPTPKFFKKLRRLGLSLTALSTGLITIPNVPATIVAFAGHAAIAGAVMVVVAQFAVENTSDLTENLDK